MSQECPDCGGIAEVTFDSDLAEKGSYTIFCGNCQSEMYVPAETTARSRINAIRKIVREHSAARVEGYIVDAFTASMLLTIYNALSPTAREKFGKPSLPKLVDFGWKAVR